MIYGVSEAITMMMLRRLENQGSYDIFDEWIFLTLTLLLGKHVKILKVHYRKNKVCSVGGFCLVLDPLNVVLSLVFIGVLKRQSRHEKICMVESD